MYNLKWLCCFLFIVSTNSEAWGQKGHSTVANIAWDNLSARSQSAITQLLKQKGFSSFAKAANWPDSIREEPAYAHTKNWHYVNSPPNQVGISVPRDCPRGCVLTAFQENLRILGADKSRLDEKAEALAFVLHLIADMHQPLHVSYAFDKGGNDKAIVVNGKSMNLHYYWDTAVLAKNPSGREFARKIQKQFTPAQILAWRYDDVYQWLAESQMITQQIYKQPLTTISTQQQKSDQQLAHQRLVQAGIRAATILNKLFDK